MNEGEAPSGDLHSFDERLKADGRAANRGRNRSPVTQGVLDCPIQDRDRLRGLSLLGIAHATLLTTAIGVI